MDIARNPPGFSPLLNKLIPAGWLIKQCLLHVYLFKRNAPACQTEYDTSVAKTREKGKCFAFSPIKRMQLRSMSTSDCSQKEHYIRRLVGEIEEVSIAENNFFLVGERPEVKAF